MKKLVFVIVALLGMSSFIAQASDNTVTVDKVAYQDQEVFVKVEGSEIPQAVQDAVKEEYVGYKIEEAFKSQTDNYKLIISKNNEKMVIFYDGKGKFLKQMELEEQ